MMVKVLVYAYATGTFSSRKIAAKLDEDVAFRVLAADNFPAHRTISDFRQRHLPEFQELFVQLVQMAREVGLVKLGTLAVDGSKVTANASKHKAMSYGRMKQEEKRLRQEIRDLTDRARKADVQEDKRYGKDRRGDELPAELARREDRLETIRAARQRLKARQREEDRCKGREPGDQDRTGKPGKPFKRRFGEPEEKAQENFTDPDSRIMKRGSSGYAQSYNVQIAVDEAEQIIVAAGVTQSASDVHQLEPLLEQIQETTGQYPDKTLADAGYRSESNLQMLEEKGIEGFVAMGPQAERRVEATGSRERSDLPDGPEDEDAQRTESLRQAQVPGRASLRLDQVGDGISPLQRPRRGEGDRGMEPSLPRRESTPHEPSHGVDVRSQAAPKRSGRTGARSLNPALRARPATGSLRYWI